MPQMREDWVVEAVYWFVEAVNWVVEAVLKFPQKPHEMDLNFVGNKTNFEKKMKYHLALLLEAKEVLKAKEEVLKITILADLL